MLTGLAVVNGVRHLTEVLDLEWDFLVLYLLSMLLESACVVLLFTPAANRWFRAAKLARSKA